MKTGGKRFLSFKALDIYAGTNGEFKDLAVPIVDIKEIAPQVGYKKSTIEPWVHVKSVVQMKGNGGARYYSTETFEELVAKVENP